ncbi:hypothetical protein MRX96_038212 [Rhipicephalus microplus]
MMKLAPEVSSLVRVKKPAVDDLVTQALIAGGGVRGSIPMPSGGGGMAGSSRCGGPARERRRRRLRGAP